MTTNDSQVSMPPRPDGQTTSAARPLFDTIEALLGRSIFVDLSFPLAGMAGNPSLESMRMLRLPRPELETSFLLRFRQSGGHMPVQAIDLSSSGLIWPPLQISQDNRSAVVVSFEGAGAAIAASGRLHGSHSSFLFPVHPADTADPLAANSRFREYRHLRLTDCNAGPSFDLFVPQAAPQGPPKGGSSWDGNVKPEEVIFASEGANVVVDARSMIHDGGHLSEGDGTYSWLWTGPSTHFRLILPQLAGARSRLAEICVPRTEEDSNLDLLAVQFDGRPVEHHVDRWSAMSGKITVEIPHGSDYSVLTLIVPKLTHDANSGRLLGLCLDKLILTP
jgi:hypothetical protein